MSIFHEKISFLKPVAVELFSCAWCNLDCIYCSIPKDNDILLKKHNDIINEIKNDPEKVIDRICKFYDEDKIQIISHWGTEPSLTIKYFDKFYDLVLKRFKKFDTISFSSNFISNTKDVINFINNFNDDKVINFNIQMSLDGPEWVTDVSRRQGSTKTIINNIVKFFKGINENENLKHKISVHFKPTLPKEYFKIMDSEKLNEYYLFFNNVLHEMFENNKNNKINIAKETIHFTIVCPQDYTTEDGKEFSSLYLRTKYLSEFKKYKYVQPFFSYYSAFKRLLDFGNEFFTKQRMFTCSAGDTQFGISNNINPCHDTYYYDIDEYEELLLKDNDRLHNTNEFIRNKSFEITKKQMVHSFDSDNIKNLEYIYRLRSFHDFAKFKIANSVSMILLMAKCGQVSDVYKNIKMAELLAIFSCSRHSCLAQNQLYFGSMNINHPGYFKLFGNGLIENFIKDTFKK